MRAGADVDLPGLLRRRRLARVRRLRRAAAGRRLRGRRHEARAPLEAAPTCCSSASTPSRSARIQGSLPERMHVVLGTHERESLRVADFLAYYHRVRARFVRRGRRPGSTSTRCRSSFCGRCDFQKRCESAGATTTTSGCVARMRRDQIARLEARRDRHASRRSRTRPTRPGRRRWRRARSRRCATRPRCRSPRATDGHAWKVLAARAGAAASSCCRRRATGDLFFDIEGDPFWEPGRGLEYLWGIVDTRRRVPPVLGARPRAGAAGGRGRDRPDPRAPRRAIPAMHVYHYAAYEVTALKRLTCEYGTREEELDDLLRAQGLRRPLQGRLAGAAASRTRATDSRRSRRSTSSATPTCAPATTRSSSTRSWLERARRRRSSTRSPPTTRRTASRRCSCATGCCRSGPARAPQPEARRAARAAARARAETEELRAALLAGLPDDPYERRRRRPAALAAGAAARSTTAARRSRSGGRSSTGSGGPARSCRSATRRRSAGSSRRGRRSARRSRSSGRSASRRSSTTSRRATPSSIRRPAGRQGRSTRSTRRRGTLALRRGPKLEERAAAGGADPRRAVRHAGAAGGAAAARPLGARRRRDATSRPKSILVPRAVPGAARRRTTSRRRSSSSPGSSGRHLVDPGAARIGQDLHRRAG